MSKTISVDVYNNLTYVREMDDECSYHLSKALNIVYSRYSGRKRIYEKSVNLYNRFEKSFPTGYLERLADKLETHKINIEFEDFRTHQKNTITLPKLELNQERWDNQKAMIESLKDNPVGFISSITGSGKSGYIRDIIDYYRVRTLVVAPTEVIRDELHEMLSECFGSKNVFNSFKTFEYSMKSYKTDNKRKSWCVDINADIKENNLTEEELYLKEKGFEKIANKHIKVRRSESSKGFREYPPILVICPNSIGNLPFEYVSEHLELIITDEGHTGTTTDNRDVGLVAKKAPYRYAVSASNWRDRKEDMELLVSAYGSKIVFEELPKDSIEKGRVKKPIYIQKSAPQPDENLWDVKNPDEIIKKCIVGNRTRNTFIINETIELLNMGRRVMICVEEAAHATLLKERLNKEGIEALEYYSKMPAKLKRINKDIASNSKKPFVIVSTMALGIGADTRAVDAILMVAGGKSTIKTVQRPGRGGRKDGELELLIIDIFDYFNPITMKWSKARSRFLNWYYTSDDSVIQGMAKRHGIKLKK